MNWLVKKLANEDSYYRIFLGTLVAYAILGVSIFALSVNFAPRLVDSVGVLLLIGAAIIGASAPVIHSRCYNKVMEDGTPKDTV